MQTVNQPLWSNPLAVTVETTLLFYSNSVSMYIAFIVIFVAANVQMWPLSRSLKVVYVPLNWPVLIFYHQPLCSAL